MKDRIWCCIICHFRNLHFCWWTWLASLTRFLQEPNAVDDIPLHSLDSDEELQPGIQICLKKGELFTCQQKGSLQIYNFTIFLIKFSRTESYYYTLKTHFYFLNNNTNYKPIYKPKLWLGLLPAVTKYMAPWTPRTFPLSILPCHLVPWSSPPLLLVQEEHPAPDYLSPLPPTHHLGLYLPSCPEPLLRPN